MDAGAQGRRQPAVAGNHQGEAADAADPSQVAAECRSPRLAVVPQDDGGEAAWQARNSWAGIGQPACIGEQPEPGKVRAGLAKARWSCRMG